MKKDLNGNGGALKWIHLVLLIVAIVAGGIAKYQVQDVSADVRLLEAKVELQNDEIFRALERIEKMLNSRIRTEGK